MLDKTSDKSSNPSTSHSTVSSDRIGSGSRPAVSMADLMASYKKPMPSLTKGELIEGTITKLTPQEVLVDINAKTDAVVMEKEKRLLKSMLQALKVGDKVTVSVLNPESDLGHPVVSLRRFMGDASWKYLEILQKEQKQLDVTITEATRGGYVVTTNEGVSGFLPNSHTAFSQAEGQSIQDMVGKKLTAYVLELSRSANKIIFSQKKVLTSADFSKATASIKKGEVISVVVTNVASFGVFVAVTVGEDKSPSTSRRSSEEGSGLKLDGLIHISEVAWDKTTDLTGMFIVGQTLQAKVIGFDREGKRVDLSLKQLSVDPFEKVSMQYAVDQQVSGNIVSVGPLGVEVTLADGTSAFIRKEKIPPTITFVEGDSVNATVVKVDKRKQRIELAPVLAAKPLGYR